MYGCIDSKERERERERERDFEIFENCSYKIIYIYCHRDLSYIIESEVGREEEFRVFRYVDFRKRGLIGRE